MDQSTQNVYIVSALMALDLLLCDVWYPNNS